MGFLSSVEEVVEVDGLVSVGLDDILSGCGGLVVCVEKTGGNTGGNMAEKVGGRGFGRWDVEVRKL